MNLGFLKSIAVVRSKHPFPCQTFKWLISNEYIFEFNQDDNEKNIKDACEIVKNMNVTLFKNIHK